MRGIRWIAPLLIGILLAGCGERGRELPPPAEPVELTLRVIADMDGGALLFAEQGEEGAGIYTAANNPDCFPVSPRAGQLVTVRCEQVCEGLPMQLLGIVSAEAEEDGFDDLCALYLRVLEELWARDVGLNEGVQYISTDLSQTRLSPAERSAVAWAFATMHGAEPLELGFDALQAEGYITAAEPNREGQSAPYFPHWEDGLLFTIREEGDALFHASKWRSALGAYSFESCTAAQDSSGAWGEWHIGQEVIA